MFPTRTSIPASACNRPPMTANTDTITDLDNKVAKLDAERLSLKSVSLWQITWRRLFRRKSAVVGMVILGILIFVALTAQWISPYDPAKSMLDIKDYPVKPVKRGPPCIHILGCPQDQPQH